MTQHEVRFDHLVVAGAGAGVDASSSDDDVTTRIFLDDADES